MNLTLKVLDSPRVYVERIDITGSTTTRDKVIRREFRINEGDAFNAMRLKRSQYRIQSLGYFQEKLEVKQTGGSGPDRVFLSVNVEEKPTGQLSLSGGYSSLVRFVIQLAVSQNNFMGKGQSLDAGINYSQYSKSISAGFTDPYFLDKPILLGFQLYRRDYSSFQYIGNERNTTYEQNCPGMGGSWEEVFPPACGGIGKVCAPPPTCCPFSKIGAIPSLRAHAVRPITITRGTIAARDPAKLLALRPIIVLLHVPNCSDCHR